MMLTENYRTWDYCIWRKRDINLFFYFKKLSRWWKN